MTDPTAPDCLNKPLRMMADDEVTAVHRYWSECVASAPGWASAYFAAKQLEGVQHESDRRKLGLVNNYKIVVG